MTTQVNIEYLLEQITINSVNVVKVFKTEIDGEEFEVKRSRICFSNSPIGREKVQNFLPEQYVNAIFTIWGDTPTLSDPQQG